ncbi:hypothetical protein, partial [Lacticaseibacillus manihotivorans]|uniref:hypothetical protein n=1 Tax=Lacticaseibacillus manihotivorans TaxID=88233 RepID=UPI001F3348DD
RLTVSCHGVANLFLQFAFHAKSRNFVENIGNQKLIALSLHRILSMFELCYATPTSSVEELMAKY